MSISPPPFFFHFITVFGVFQYKNAFRQSEKLPKLFISEATSLFILHLKIRSRLMNNE
jgi:hypothetical protein